MVSYTGRIGMIGAVIAAVLTVTTVGAKVLPPAPDDQPPSCPSLVFSSCGIERFCELDPTGSSYCLHKTLFPITIRDVIAWLLVGLCCLVAAMAGIGGGGLALPVIILSLNFTAKEASVLSNSAVFGNCIGQFIINRCKSGQLLGVDAIIDTVMMVLPALIAGGSAAIAIEGLVPSTVILILALLSLILASIKTYVKARQMRRDEKSRSVVDDSSGPTNHDYTSGNDSMSETGSSITQYHSLERMTDDSSLPFSEFSCGKSCSYRATEILITLCWALNAITFLMVRGGIFPKCSTGYFTFVGLPTVFAAIFVWRGRILIHRRKERLYEVENNELSLRTSLIEQETNSHNGVDYDGPTTNETSNPVGITEDDEKAFNNLAWWLPFVSLIIGLLSALLGIGGGELVGPILLLLNMKPVQSSATTAMLSLLNSGTNTLHFALTNMVISPGYTFIFGVAGFLGGLGGRCLAIEIAMRSGRGSIIAFSLLFVLCIAGSLVAFELVTTPRSWGSESIC